MLRLVRSPLFNFLFGSMFGAAIGGALLTYLFVVPTIRRAAQIVAQDAELRDNYERAAEANLKAIEQCKGALAAQQEKVLRARGAQ